MKTDGANLFPDFRQGFLPQFLLGVQRLQMAVGIVYAQRLAIRGCDFEMLVQIFPIVAGIQRLRNGFS